ncbi:MAG: hypothetical protein HS111_36455 [Kofleriaceae bacterium]|nr:hypothetical protein [Kofleriaceae bacterium]
MPRQSLGIPLALLCALAACAGTTGRVAEPGVSDDVRAARAALGPVDDVLEPADDPRPRLRALRDLADRLGNGAEAGDAAAAALTLSRQRLVLALDAGGDVAAARREVEADRDAALAVLERHTIDWRVPEVTRDLAPDDPRTAVWFRILARGGWLPDDVLTSAQAAARTPQERALVARAAPVVPRLEREVLVELGPPFVDLLERRLYGEVTAGDLAAVRATARALLAVDPLHAPARLVLALDAEAAAGGGAVDPELLRAVLGVTAEGPWMDGARAVAIVAHAEQGAPAAAAAARGGLGAGSRRAPGRGQRASQRRRRPRWRRWPPTCAGSWPCTAARSRPTGPGAPAAAAQLAVGRRPQLAYLERPETPSLQALAAGCGPGRRARLARARAGPRRRRRGDGRRR